MKVEDIGISNGNESAKLFENIVRESLRQRGYKKMGKKPKYIKHPPNEP